MATEAHSNIIPSRVETVRRALQRSQKAGELQIARLSMEPDGALLVEGEAASVAAKKHALRVAAIASGAPGLVDRLRVRVAKALSDGEIRTEVADRFALDPRFQDVIIEQDRDPSPLSEDYAPVVTAPTPARGRVAVEVSDGAVTLDGAVPSLVRKRLAGAIAWRTPGVRDVINGLAVEPPEDDSPDELEEAVREVLDGNPLFDDAQVKVGVFGEAVRLTGIVHSADARRAAEEEAWRVLGVEEVVNEIEVRP